MHGLVKVLDAEAQAIEAKGAQFTNAFGVNGARVDFLEKFDPRLVWSAFVESDLNVFMAVPTIYHRLLVLAARVLVSHYRIVVVVDPEPWVDSRRGDLWRAALVRASVGRTAIWITADPELADRADYVHELVDGSLRPS